MRTALQQATDLTARARIRDAAFRLFAEKGVAATSMRAIAEAAGTSPALVVHHFATKEGLVHAVDEAVVEAFRAALADISGDMPPDTLSSTAGAAFARVIGADPTLRKYFRRSLLEDHPASSALVDELLELTEEGLALLDQIGGLRSDSDPVWRPYQVLFLVLGPLLLESLLQRNLDGKAFDDNVIRRRTAANHDFFSRGLLTHHEPAD